MEGEAGKEGILIFGRRTLLVAALLVPVFAGPAAAVEPGVDIAAPRVVVSTVTNALFFQKANQVVEPGDHVSWRYLATVRVHTTTSGAVCGVPDGLWDAPLDFDNPEFTRQFLDPPGAYPYYCGYHCLNNMKGQVTVTTPIDLRANDAFGMVTLTWTGGGGLSQVYRSAAPTFGPAAGTVSMAPSGGDAGTSFTDTTVPPLGGASFYLVENKQPAA